MRLLFITFLTLSAFFLEAQEEPTLTIVPFEGISQSGSVYQVYQDKSSLLWAATSYGLYLINPGAGDAIQKWDQEDVRSVVMDGNKNIWASAQNKIKNISSDREVVLENDGIIVDMEYDRDHIWIATNKGLFQFRIESGRVTQYNSRNSELNSNKINFIHKDKQGILWIGTEAGYVRIEGDKWEDEDKDYNMIASAENEEGQWIVSEEDMILLNKYNRLFPVGLDKNYFSGNINDFTIDQEGKIYLASDIFVRYDPYGDVVENFSEDAGFLAKKCISIERDKVNNIWIGTKNSGLYRLVFSDNYLDAISATVVVENPVSCPGESDASLKVVVAGGTSPFSYEWSSPGLEGDNPQNLSAGSYSVTITDADARSYVSSIAFSEPSPLEIVDVLVEQISEPGAADASIRLVASGGSGEYTYQWSDGSIGNELINLSSGDYQVTITDKYGCSATSSATILQNNILPQLLNTEITVGTTLRLEKLSFQADSSNLEAYNYPILNEIYDFLRDNENVVIEVGGHTNTIPPHAYCDKLSTERAKSVAEYILSRGIREDRIFYKGYGKRQPLKKDKSVEGRKINQRVEIKILET